MTNQASEDVVDSILSTLGIVDRKSGNRPGQIQVVKQIIRTEKQKLLAEVRERVVGEDEKLVIPDYPKTDDEGEPLYSKRAAKEGRKQVTARYHTRKELRNDQRTELTKLEAEL